MFTTLPLELFVCREVHFTISCFSHRIEMQFCSGGRAVLLSARNIQHAAARLFHDRHSLLLYAQYVFEPCLYWRVLACLTCRLSQVALVTCDLGVMLEITGGASATALAFIFPAACYMRLADQGVPWYARSKLPALACVAFGAIVMAISLFLALGKVWTPEGGARICV